MLAKVLPDSNNSGYITLAEGTFDETGELTFTFEDAYWSYKNGFGWSDEKGYEATTYTVSCKVQNLMNGDVTLEFMTRLNGFMMKGSNEISVQKDYYDYVLPQKLYENDTEEVTVSQGGLPIATFNLENTMEVKDGDIFILLPNGENEDVTFTFDDKYCTDLRFIIGPTWSDKPSKYTATATVEALKAGTAQLNFTRQ